MASHMLLCVCLLAVVFISSTAGQCGSSTTLIANANVQSITSPSYPDKYGPDMSCQWNITTNTPRHVVHFDAVDMSLAPNCKDAVEIYDGDLSTLIQKGCGRNTFSVQSKKNFTIVKFKSDDLRQGRGFKLNYWSATSYSDACSSTGNTIDVADKPVILRLPNLGDSTDKKTCQYTFKASSKDSMITLSFKTWTEMKGLTCMTVYDGDDTTGVKMFEGCPSERPFWDMDSSGQSITVVIESTGDDMARFHLKAKAMTGDCAKPITLGFISSYIWFPNYKDAAGKYCTRQLSAPYETIARVDVVYSLTNKSMVSCSDFVPFSVKDGKGAQVDKDCYYGTTTTFMNQSDTMELIPNNTATDRVLLKVTSFGCQKSAVVVKTDKRNESSPMYPSEYPLESVCTWQFVSYRPDYVIVVEVMDSDLPEDCTDYVAVIDGENQNDKKLGEWCGNRKKTYRGTGQVMTLTFRSRGTTKTGHKGFRFRYYADTPIARELDSGTNILMIAAILSIILLVGGIIFVVYQLCSKKKSKGGDEHPLTE